MTSPSTPAEAKQLSRIRVRATISTIGWAFAAGLLAAGALTAEPSPARSDAAFVVLVTALGIMAVGCLVLALSALISAADVIAYDFTPDRKHYARITNGAITASVAVAICIVPLVAR